MIYLQLFLSFLKIGLFGFGGGLAVISLIQHEVESHGWMTQEQFVDIVAVSQVTPGPIGINCATYVGYTATGSVLGSALATAAIVIPSLVIMLLICKAYFVVKTRFQHSVYFTNTMRMLRFAVLGLPPRFNLLSKHDGRNGRLLLDSLLRPVAVPLHHAPVGDDVLRDRHHLQAVAE